MLRWEHTAIQNTSAHHSRLALITASVIMALFPIQNHFPEMLYLLAGNALRSNAQVNTSLRKKYPEVKRKRGLVALKNNIASVSLESLEKKTKKYGQKCCAATKCSNPSDNQPDLSFHAFPKDLKTRKE